MPSATLVAHAGSSFAWPSTDTRQMRQLPTMGSLGYQHSVGMSIPAARGASRIVASAVAVGGGRVLAGAGVVLGDKEVLTPGATAAAACGAPGWSIASAGARRAGVGG